MARTKDRASGSASAASSTMDDADDSFVSSVLAGQNTIREWQEDLYCAIHQHPELSTQELHTAATLPVARA